MRRKIRSSWFCEGLAGEGCVRDRFLLDRRELYADPEGEAEVGSRQGCVGAWRNRKTAMRLPKARKNEQ